MLQRNLKTKGRQSVSERGEDFLEKKEILNLRQSVGLIFQGSGSSADRRNGGRRGQLWPMNLKLSEQEVRNRVEKALAAMELLSIRKKPS